MHTDEIKDVNEMQLLRFRYKQFYIYWFNEFNQRASSNKSFG